MTCPRCETRNLIELDRDGISIDRCEHCRGIWLDRGELDKLLAQAREPRDLDDDDSDDRGRHDRYARPEPRGERRRSFWDIFD